MVASNPMLQQMVEQNPRMAAMLQNPEFLRQMADPNTMQQMMQMHGTLAAALPSTFALHPSPFALAFP